VYIALNTVSGYHKSTILEPALKLIEDKNPALTKAVKSIAKGVDTIDKIAQKLYSRL